MYSGVASARYSLNTLQSSGKVKTVMLMVIEMAIEVAFQPFSSSKLQYSERWSCEALREKEELHVKLKSVTNTQWIPWTVFNQSKCSIVINKFLINLQNNGTGRRNFSSVRLWLVIEQQSTVARARSLTSKLIKVIMCAVGKRSESIYGEIKREFRSYAFFSKKSIIPLVCHFHWKVHYSLA